MVVNLTNVVGCPVEPITVEPITVEPITGAELCFCACGARARDVSRRMMVRAPQTDA